MLRTLFCLLLPIFCVINLVFAQKNKTDLYFPAANNWQIKKPAELGLNPAKIQEVISFAKENEIKNKRKNKAIKTNFKLNCDE